MSCPDNLGRAAVSSEPTKGPEMLTWTSDIQDNMSVSVSHADQQTDGRILWRWTITLGCYQFTGQDLRTAIYEPADALRALASFLGAWQEAQSYPDSENRDLFPAELANVIDQGFHFIDELAMDFYTE